MKALIRKELLELGASAGLMFLALSVIWIAVAAAKDFIPPQEEPLMSVLVAAGFAGVLLAFFQFLRERRTGTLGYAVHRGTGADGLFLAKIVAGLAATTLVALGPPLVFTAWQALVAFPATAVQWMTLGEMARLSVFGASAYAVGVLGSQLRRGLFLDITVAVVAAGGCSLIGMIILRSGGPWSARLWIFALAEATIAIAALLIARSFFLRSADRDLPLPVSLHLAFLAIAIVTVVPMFALIAKSAQSEWRRDLDEVSATIFVDKANAEFVVGRRDEAGVMRRIDTGAQIEEGNKQFVPSRDGLVEFRRTGPTMVCGPHWGESSPPSQDPAFDPRIGFWPGFGRHWIALDLPSVAARISTSRSLVVMKAFLDADEGVVRILSFEEKRGLVTEVSIPEGQLLSMQTLPFTLALEKPGSGGRFSRFTRVINAVRRSWRRYEARVIRSYESASAVPDTASCLLDTHDGTLWTLDPRDLRSPLHAVELPDGDRYVGIERFYDKAHVRFGRYWEQRSPLVRGEHGLYMWDGSKMVVNKAEDDGNEFEPDEVVAESDAAARVEMLVAATDRDVLTPAVEIRDAKDGRLLFSYRFEPTTTSEKTLAALIQACVLINPPVLNAVGFAREPRDPKSARYAGFDEPLLAGQSRPGLLAASMLVALASMIAAWRRLRARGASTALTFVSAAIAGLFGPLAFALVWALEPRRAAQLASEPRGSEERALLIESA